MKSKTKFFSILIFALLALPVVFYRPDNGQVLGVSETNPSSPSINSIGSGVRETDAIQKQTNSITGKVILDPQQKVPVSTNKFSLGSSIVIKTKNQEFMAVINQINPSLPEDVALSLNQETYDKLNQDAEFFEAEIVKQ
jgi:hypothetical protein